MHRPEDITMNDRELAIAGLALLILAGTLVVTLDLGDEDPSGAEEEVQQPPEARILEPSSSNVTVAAQDSPMFTVEATGGSSPVERVIWRQGNLTLLSDPCPSNCSSYESRLIRTFETPGNHRVQVQVVDTEGRTGTTSIHVQVQAPPEGKCTDSLPCAWLVAPANGTNGTSDKVRVEVTENEMFELETMVDADVENPVPLDAVRWVQGSGSELRNSSCEAGCRQADRYSLLWSFDEPGTYRIETQAISDGRIQDVLGWTVAVQES